MSRTKTPKKRKVQLKVKPKNTFKNEPPINGETLETAIIVTELYRHLIGHSKALDNNTEVRKYFANQFTALEKSTFFPLAEENYVMNAISKEEKRAVSLCLDDLPGELQRISFIYQLAENTIEMFSDVEEKRVVEYAISFSVYDKKVMLRVAKRLLDGGWNCDFFSYGLPINFIEQYLSDTNLDVELISPFGDAKFPSDNYIISSLQRWVDVLTTMMFHVKTQNKAVQIIKRPYNYNGHTYQLSIAESTIFCSGGEAKVA